MACNKCGGVTKGLVGLAQSHLNIGVADDQTIASRRQSCEGCPEWEHGKCRRCGCYTHAKTRLTRERCPLGRWDSV